MSAEEIRIRKMITHHQVRHDEIADEMDIPVSSLTYHLKSLTPSKVETIEGIILDLSNQRTPQKVAS